MSSNELKRKFLNPVIYWQFNPNAVNYTQIKCKRDVKCYAFFVLCAECVLILAFVFTAKESNLYDKWWFLYLRIPMLMRSLFLLLSLTFTTINPLYLIDTDNNWRLIGSRNYKIIRNLSYYRLLGLWYLSSVVNGLIDFISLIIYPYFIYNDDSIGDDEKNMLLVILLILDIISMGIFKLGGYVIYYTCCYYNTRFYLHKNNKDINRPRV